MLPYRRQERFLRRQSLATGTGLAPWTRDLGLDPNPESGVAIAKRGVSAKFRNGARPPGDLALAGRYVSDGTPALLAIAMAEPVTACIKLPMTWTPFQGLLKEAERAGEISFQITRIIFSLVARYVASAMGP